MQAHDSDSFNQGLAATGDLQSEIATLIGEIKPAYFRSKRWFGSKSRQIKGCRLLDLVVLAEKPLMVLTTIEIDYSGGDPEMYQLPLVLQPYDELPTAIQNQDNAIVGQITTSQGQLLAYDAFANDDFCKALYHAIYEKQEKASQQGKFKFETVGDRLAQPEVESMKRISTEQSNTSIIYNGQVIFKAYRKLAAGQNPDFEIPFFLTTHTDFRYTPPVAGYIEYTPASGQAISMGMMQDFVENSGDGHNYTLEHLRNYFAKVEEAGAGLPNIEEKAAEFAQPYAAAAKRLGEITGLMHNALASQATFNDPEFEPKVIGDSDIKGWQESITELIRRVIRNINRQLETMPVNLRQQLELVASHEQDYLKLIDKLAVLQQEKVHKTRYHGDYHLGQVLRTGEDFAILDFEGEPARSLAERRAKHSPLKDVAGMLRSFNYAAYSGLFETQEGAGSKLSYDELEKWALAWEQVARAAFLQGYNQATGQHNGARFLPASPEALDQAIKVFEVEKAFYELNYEFNNRPTWVPIPVQGLLRILRQAGQ